LPGAKSRIEGLGQKRQVIGEMIVLQNDDVAGLHLAQETVLGNTGHGSAAAQIGLALHVGLNIDQHNLKEDRKWQNTMGSS
jgi:hypothetical protein